MTDPYSKLREHFEKIHRIDHAMTFLHWDHMVMMPPGGNHARSNSLAELAAIRHELMISETIPELVAQVRATTQNVLVLRSVKEIEREYQHAACLPARLVKAKTLAGAKCEHDWRKQRQENDWHGFLANFREVVQLSIEEAHARFDSSTKELATPYDALLELYCTGDDSEFIAGVFTELKQHLPNLLQEVLEKQQEHNFIQLSGTFAINSQRELNTRLMTILGFDFASGRMDVSAHPFSTGCRGDQRITTRFRETEFLEALLSTAHETGHAAYESGLPPEWDGLPIGTARNLCIHESQSLFFEKQIFLAKSFMSFFQPKIRELLPAVDASPEQLWRAATRVQPSYIRVEADEVTYPLHVILRFEIEKKLINGHIKADDIPQLWDEKMQKFLGLSTKDNYRDGCIQDMHWSDGTFGYFPSYTIGALNSAQLFAALKREHSDLAEQLGCGNVAGIRDWLSRKVWTKGSSVDSQEIIAQATGEKTNPKYFLAHLRDRYLNEDH